MAGQNTIFRKVSLDRLSSPEQLDQKLTVVSPTGWVALVSMGILIAASLAWGFWGSVSNKVHGSGVLMYGDGIVKLLSQTDGQITDIAVCAGDFVEYGQVIATVSQDDLARQIDQCIENLSMLEAVYDDTLDFNIDSLNSEIYLEFAQLASQIRSARIQYETQENAAQQNENISMLMEQFADLKQVKLRDYLKQLDELQSKFSRDSVITAGFSGTVSDLNIRQYDFVQSGSLIGNIVREDQSSEPPVVILYVPLDKGKLIQEGMEVGVSPATVNREEHGYIIGQVETVSAYAVSQDHMMATLQNQQLVQQFGGQLAVIEVKIELLRDESTVSGYKWSTPKGAPITIDAGTVCAGEIKVSSQKPIDLVIPYIKKLFSGTVGEAA